MPFLKRGSSAKTREEDDDDDEEKDEEEEVRRKEEEAHRDLMKRTSQPEFLSNRTLPSEADHQSSKFRTQCHAPTLFRCVLLTL